MNAYQHILWATDFSEEALQVGARAKEIAGFYGARLSLIHVIEQISLSNTSYELIPVMPTPLLPEETLQEIARESLARLAEQLDIKEAQQGVVVAVSTKEGILSTALEQKVDLIVVGSHGRHGLALLLGSTANAVLHGAPCDVLAVRIHS